VKNQPVPIPVQLKPVERRSISDEVVVRLSEYIVNRELRAGDKLPPERELMESLQVGRSSLREAIKALRAVGVIDVIGGGGMYVGNGGMNALTEHVSWAIMLNASSMQQAVEAREVLEVELAGFAAKRISDEQLLELRSCLDRMRLSGNDAQSYLAADVAFHLGIARAAGNDILYYSLEMLQHVIRASIRRVLRKAGEPASLDEHEGIYDALARHDREDARRFMRAHLKAAGQRLLAASLQIDNERSTD
jgi:GntR family transcriptional repressor for pyruvate dehydrogenase complex